MRPALGDEVSEQQWRHIMELLKVRGTEIDLAYTFRAATDLGVADLLERALRKSALRADP
ncbi:MAG TPA: hypothetical protein VF278_25485 [Pirellulales bacterium]